MKARVLGLAIGLPLLCSCSTSLDVQTVGRPGVYGSPGSNLDCGIKLYGKNEALPPDCTVEIGDVWVGDDGTSNDCGMERVSKVAVREACQWGADAAQLVDIQTPASSISSCYQIRARFLLCRPAAEKSS